MDHYVVWVLCVISTCIFFMHGTVAAVNCLVPSTSLKDLNIDHSDDGSNTTNNNEITQQQPQQQQQQQRYSYCDHGCCPANSDGCCQSRRHDIIAYGGTAFGILFFGAMVVFLTCRKKKKKNPPRQSRNQCDEAPLPYAEGPPSYSECTASNTTSRNESTPTSSLQNSGDSALQLDTDNLALEGHNEDSNHLPPPPAYRDIFKQESSVDHFYQIAVINENGDVSFRENNSVGRRNSSNGLGHTDGSGGIPDGAPCIDTSRTCIDSNNNSSSAFVSQDFDVTRL